MTPNQQAFLDTISFSEGTCAGKHPTTQKDGYDVIVTGADGVPEIFTNFAFHPFSHGRASKLINKQGLTSNASGRYQFMLRDWKWYSDLLKLPDFSPASQDKWALQLIKERRAMPAIEAGDFETAIRMCKNLWASLPGAGYAQHENQIDDLKAHFRKCGGVCK